MAAETQPQDGLQLLAADHRKVEGLFADFEKASGASAKQKLVQQICTELKVHTQIEEEIYYPAIRGKVEEDELDEAWVEHDSAKTLINELEAAAPDEELLRRQGEGAFRADRASCQGGGKAARQSLPADPRGGD